MHNKKIAIFMPSLRGGGAERVIVNLLQGFSGRNIDVDLVVAKAEGPHICKVPDDIRLIDLKANSVLSSLPALAYYLRKVKPASLLSVMDHCNLVALWAKTISGVPAKMVFSIHNTLSQETAGVRSFKVKLFPTLIRLFYRFADEIIAVSQGVADDQDGFSWILWRRISRHRDIHRPRSGGKGAWEGREKCDITIRRWRRC